MSIKDKVSGFTKEEWETIIHSVAQMKETFNEQDVYDLGEWIRKAKIDGAIAGLIMKGNIYACCDGKDVKMKAAT